MEFCCVLSFFMSEGDPQCCLIAWQQNILSPCFTAQAQGWFHSHRHELGCAHTNPGAAWTFSVFAPPLSVPLSACAFGGRAPRADHVPLLETKPAVLAAFCTALSVLLCCFSGSHFPVGVVPPRTKSPTPESSTIASYVTLRKNKKIDLRTVLQNNLWSLVATPKVRVIFILLTKKIIVLKAWYTRLVEIAIERMIKL